MRQHWIRLIGAHAPIAIACALFGWAAPARALNGPAAGAATADTLTLPPGPGSVRGLADDASITVFSGQVSYSVPIDLPPGPAGFGPKLALAYTGELGNGPLGIGWTLGEIAIRRSLRHGVPSYTDADELELVGVGEAGRLASIGNGEYRVEGQGNRIRVVRHGDRFDVTGPDGAIYALGVTSASREESAGQIAAWFAESIVNLSDQQIVLTYDKDQNEVFLSGIKWGPGEIYQAKIVYDGRNDQVVSYRTGFLKRCARRVSRINVFSELSGAENLIRSYRLSYDDQVSPGAAFPVSRLASIQMLGSDGATALPTLSFTYASLELAETIPLEGTDSWVLNQRDVSFTDVDGDGAEDLLRLEAGNYVYLPNRGAGRFGPPQPMGASFNITLENGRLFDINGDARPELVEIVGDTWRYYTLEDGTWISQGPWPGTTGIPLHDNQTAFADLNGDGAVDVIRGATDGINVYMNGPNGFAAPRLMPAISAADVAVVPGASNVRFVDVNGDGLADVVWLTDAWMKIFLGHGDGTFSVFDRVFNPWGQAAVDPVQVQLVDLNRDGLMDVVRFSDGYVFWYPGLPNGHFSDRVRHLGRPEGTDSDAVIEIADGDGNGSSDVVWSSPRGMWALDLAGATSAGMLAEIDNGLGKSTRFTYQASASLAAEAAAEGNAWSIKLPVPIPVVVETQIDPGVGPARVRHFGVRDGFWDASERRLGGFLQATATTLDADGPADTLIEQTQFHPGLADQRVLRGRATAVRRLDGVGHLFSTQKMDWAAIAPVDLASASVLLRRAVMTQSEMAYAENAPVARITRTVFSDLDAEARPTTEQQLGLIDVAGDERIVKRTFADDPTFWVRDKVVTETTTDAAGVIVSSNQMLYGAAQGAPLPLGQVGQGFPRETDELLTAENRLIAQLTMDYDACGNPLHTYKSGVQRTLGYDARCLHPTTESIDPANGTGVLTWTMVWDDAQARPHTLGDPSGNFLTIEYDALNRQTSSAVNAQPAHIHYTYDWTGTLPKTTTWVFDGSFSDLASEGPTWPAGSHWRQTTDVANGASETLYKTTPLGGRFLIGEWSERDERGQVVRHLEPFYSSAAFPSAPDPAARVHLSDFDAQGRTRKETLPNGATTVTTFSALHHLVTTSDLGPVSFDLDGQLRVVHSERVIGGATETVDAAYDAADRVTSVSIQNGAAVHSFTYDSLGRLARSSDPDIGDRQLVYDDRNFLIQSINGIGQSVYFDYDGAGRLKRRGESAVPTDPNNYVFTYDSAAAALHADCQVPGRLAAVTEPNGTAQFCYDILGREVAMGRTILVPDAPASTGSRTQTLSPSGLLLTEAFDDGFNTAYQYDPAGRVVSVSTDGAALWTADQLDAAGRVVSEHYGNGATEAYQYDSAGLASRITVSQASAQTLYDVTVKYNSFGAPTVVTDLDAQGLDHAASYSYDDAGRLSTASIGTGGQQYAFAYKYDALQNMTLRTVSGPKDIGILAGTYRYGERGYGPRQLTSVAPGGAP